MDTQMKSRCDELFKLGLKFNGEYYQDSKIGVFVHYTDIQCDPDDKWEKIIEDIKQLRLDDSNKPLSDTEKALIHKVLELYSEHTEEKLSDEDFATVYNLKQRLNPDYLK